MSLFQDLSDRGEDTFQVKPTIGFYPRVRVHTLALSWPSVSRCRAAHPWSGFGVGSRSGPVTNAHRRHIQQDPAQLALPVALGGDCPAGSGCCAASRTRSTLSRLTRRSRGPPTCRPGRVGGADRDHRRSPRRSRRCRRGQLIRRAPNLGGCWPGDARTRSSAALWAEGCGDL